MKRRNFVKVLAASVLACMPFACARSGSQAAAPESKSMSPAAGASVTNAAAGNTERPNFLFIVTDDQRWDAMSCVQQEMGDRGRFPWFKTPNMDRLAREGVRFRNAFVVNSLCSPSRSCFLTGQYSHINGVANNH